MAAGSDALREQVVGLLNRTLERGFEEAMHDFPMESINTRPPNVEHTPWDLLEHLRVGLWDIVEYIKDAKHVSPNWPDEYWPPAEKKATPADWAKSIESFRSDRDALMRLVEDPKTDLLAPIPHTPGHNVLREVFLAAGHSAGHLGEFSILREVMGTWRR